MKLFLQFGYGMKHLSLAISDKWKETSLILSPRDIEMEKLEKWSEDFHHHRISCYFDPQCYFVDSTSFKLISYPYWKDFLKWEFERDTESMEDLISRIKECNTLSRTVAYILPARMIQYDNAWDDTFKKGLVTITNVAKKKMTDKPIYVTLALPAGLLVQREEVLEPLMQFWENLSVDGFYLVAEPPDNQYLVDNPNWLYNVLKICASAKTKGKKVIYAYGNHQMLALSLTGIDAISSGTWLNLRHFTNRFVESEDFRKKAVWIYYPPALSEFKMAFVDWAYNHNFLNDMWLNEEIYLDENIRKILKSDTRPSMTGFNESDSFVHYLVSLEHQVQLLNKGSYEDAYSTYKSMLDIAEQKMDLLKKNGMSAQTRDFRNVLDVNRAAISELDKNYRFPLIMEWGNIN